MSVKALFMSLCKKLRGGLINHLALKAAKDSSVWVRRFQGQGQGDACPFITASLFRGIKPIINPLLVFRGGTQSGCATVRLEVVKKDFAAFGGKIKFFRLPF
jgi:hypothetical protein